jgi:hypothetical protein
MTQATMCGLNSSIDEGFVDCPYYSRNILSFFMTRFSKSDIVMKPSNGRAKP